MKKLKDEFGSKLTVIGVHVGKFEGDKASESVRKAVLKYDIDYPVINDNNSRIANLFAIKAIPSFALINVHGDLYETYEGDKKIGAIKKAIDKLISKYKFEISRDSLPEVLEKYSVIGNVLSFPAHIEYVYDFSYKSRSMPAFLISNSAKNSIIATSIIGDIAVQVGSGQVGFKDGKFGEAMFNSPRGLAFHAGKLYVADSGNSAIREIDFKTEEVRTILGSGVRGGIIDQKNNLDSSEIELSLPLDVDFFPTKNDLVIANSGSNQILSYDLKGKKLKVIAGNGKNGIQDGKYPQNSLSETSALSSYAGKLYFVDSGSSSFRVLDEGEVKTLIGNSEMKFGYKNGDKSIALMQHPSGLLVDDTGAYISDGLNNRIRKYDFTTAQIRDLAGNGKAGDKSGAITEFDEPVGIASILDRLFIIDSGNNRLLALNRGTLNSEIIDIMPPLKFQKDGFLQYLPNLQKSDEILLKSDSEIVLNLKLKNGWKINKRGPSFINLLEMVNDNKANLIASFDWVDVAANKIKLPKMISGKKYLLQGSIYYCEDRLNSLCYVKSYEQKAASELSGAEKIDIDLSNN